MTKRVALVTHILEFAGPGAAEALRQDGFQLVVHDRRFVDETERAEYQSQFPEDVVAESTDAKDLADEVIRLVKRVDVLVSNDVVSRSRYTLAEASPAMFRETFEQLTVWPFTLTQCLAPHMKERGSGALIYITSAAAARTAEGSLMYGAARAATTSMAMALSKELSRDNIQVNSIGPTFFENPTYFPPGRVESNPRLKNIIDTQVPMRRLGRQDEMGALIAFLASQKAMPMTGQFLHFAAGWAP